MSNFINTSTAPKIKCAILAALMAGAMMIGPALAHEPYLCPIAQAEATIPEQNLMGAIVRVFTARWLPLAAFGNRLDPTSGLNVVVGSDCADLITKSEHFKLFRVVGTNATYELGTATGMMMGSISFDKLGSAWQVPNSGCCVVFRGLDNSVCDGPAAPHLMVNGKPWDYVPGQCMKGYASVRYTMNVESTIQAFEYIFANLTAPAEILRTF